MNPSTSKGHLIINVFDEHHAQSLHVNICKSASLARLVLRRR
jgi:hypothetical protein